jgi:ABC-type sugar transport system ATPase subunit
MASILLDGVTVAKAGTTVVEDFSMRVDDGEAVAVLGPSGSGKSTILRAIAGLDEVISGDVLFDGEVVTSRQPAERDVAMVFQENALFPFMSVRRNVAFPLDVRGVPREETKARVDAESAVLAIGHLLERLPGTLSAGHQQLVQAARALVRRPAVFLMDEPLARMDAATREGVRRELSLLQRGYHVTTVIATNDQADAMVSADRIVVIEAGVIHQTGTPLEVYGAPADVFVAGFVGQPAMSFLPAAVDRGRVRVGSWSAPVPVEPGPVLVGVRPECWEAGASGMAGVVEACHWAGDTVHIVVSFPAGAATIRVSDPVQPGSTGRWQPTAFHVFDPKGGRAMLHGS